MAETEPIEIDDETEDEEEEAGPASVPKRRLPGRNLVLFVILPLLAVAGVAAGGYFGGLFEPAEVSAEQMVAKPKVFYELPEMLVNLSDRGEERARYLKLLVSLELPDRASRDALEPVLPRVLDLFQVYLRELRASDLEGSAGIYRLKEELVRRVNFEIHPHQVSDVLFKEIIVQ